MMSRVSFYPIMLPLTSHSRGPSPLRPATFTGSTPYKPDPLSPVDNTVHPVINAGRVAVITSAGSPIGKAAAEVFARFMTSFSLVFVFLRGRKGWD
jgi:hypothetical protein